MRQPSKVIIARSPMICSVMGDWQNRQECIASPTLRLNGMDLLQARVFGISLGGIVVLQLPMVVPEMVCNRCIVNIVPEVSERTFRGR